jgi:hypothetical protein
LGVRVRDVSTGAVAVNVAVPVIEPEVAVIMADPSAMDVATPDVALIVANPGALELQVTVFVISPVLASLKVPVAVNCWVNPTGTLGLADVTAMDDKVLAGGGGVVRWMRSSPPPPQPDNASAAISVKTVVK